MSEKGADFHLPTCPSGLCFNKDDFVKADFTVDRFLQEHQKQDVQLETLREDLGVYLKVLRSAMIELINKDYADFVNLSTNLIGLDKGINGLQVPLGQLKEEVLAVKLNLDETLSDLHQQLQRHQLIREKKSSLQNLVHIIYCLEKMEKLLGIHPNKGWNSCSGGGIGEDNKEEADVSSDLIERVATEFNHLNFCVSKCQEAFLVENMKLRIACVTEILHQGLERSFMESLQQHNAEDLRRCLRIYATIDKIQDAEKLYRTRVVDPYMEDVVSETSMQSDPQGLKGMYGNVIEFVPSQMKELMEVTVGSQRLASIRGFDFLVNSVWPEVVEKLEQNTQSIFAPGNPALFHERYSISMEFVSNFEQLCRTQNSLKQLRNQPSYLSFMSKWNLPVYFQIRFQEIAGKLELALLDPFQSTAELVNMENQFHLAATATLWKCLCLCWAEDIYLHALVHRFWKLTLQLVSRYSLWVAEIQKQQELKKEEASTEGSNSSGTGDGLSSSIKPVDSFYNLRTVDSSSNLRLVESSPNLRSLEAENNGQPMSLVSLTHVVTLIMDVTKLVALLPDFLEEHVMKRLANIGFQKEQLLRESLQESSNALTDHIPALSTYVVAEMSNRCCYHLRLVSDIPRLYRRTNHDVPTRPCQYVSASLGPLQEFWHQHTALAGQQNIMEWLKKVLSLVAKQYFSSVSDVLTSVQKMEESLKRLKKARERGSGASTDTSRGMSDDDKIRLQLALDVQSFAEEVEKFGIDRKGIETLMELLKLVEAARSGSRPLE